MIIQLDCGVTLRRPEPEDVPALYSQKNDPEVAGQLGGFSRGYSLAAIRSWVDSKAESTSDLVWIVADSATNACLGHVGLYQIDHRAGAAEFAIMIGAKESWGRGVGSCVTRAVVSYGFRWLNLHRVSLTVLEGNTRAIALYEKIGFRREGLLRDAQYKDGSYLSVVAMGLLRGEYQDAA